MYTYCSLLLVRPPAAACTPFFRSPHLGPGMVVEDHPTPAHGDQQNACGSILRTVIYQIS